MNIATRLAVLMGLASGGSRVLSKSRFMPGAPRLGAKWCTKHNGPGTAKSYHNRPGSGLLTREEIDRRRGGNPKGGY
ncbi:MAG: hypothetical protein CVU73_10980 [Deltaproteobacteria bacterium HGW-Deltaproteobacteria-8]|jgi:hypothetical protein|nr:MAG: hypothetical protein CVU73_10980 [Deltaproteobacteria bacterium HGW-Deltaproteobacteria-8]